MALPSMPSAQVSREFLRIAGGYGSPAEGSSPAGGLDIDNAGNLATDGDVTVAGQLDVQGGDLTNSAGNITLDAFSAAANTTIALKNSDATFKANVDAEGDMAVHGNLDTDGYLHAKTNVAADNGTDKIVVKPNNIEMTRVTGAAVYLDSMTTGNAMKVRTSNVSQRDTIALSVEANGNANIAGDIAAASGDVVAGTDGGTRGVVAAWDGSGGNAPGCLKIGSPNGTVWYVFVEDDGTLKIHNALPTQNADGSVVGAQT